MQAKGLVDVEQDRVGDDAQPNIQPLDRDRPDLLSLRLGVAIEARHGGRKQDLEGMGPRPRFQREGVRTPSPSAPQSGGGSETAGVPESTIASITMPAIVAAA
jgi:hypothetical protein